jgi:hypothetical protein
LFPETQHCEIYKDGQTQDEDNGIPCDGDCSLRKCFGGSELVVYESCTVLNLAYKHTQRHVTENNQVEIGREFHTEMSS